MKAQATHWVWFARDPSGFAAGQMSLYSYYGNSAANHTDPSVMLRLGTWVLVGTFSVSTLVPRVVSEQVASSAECRPLQPVVRRDSTSFSH